MTVPIFISRQVVLNIQRASLERHGGGDGLRESGLLDSVLMQPEAGCGVASNARVPKSPRRSNITGTNIVGVIIVSPRFVASKDRALVGVAERVGKT